MIDSHVVHLDDVVYRNNKQLIAYDEYIYIKFNVIIVILVCKYFKDYIRVVITYIIYCNM